jgi:serine/threonine protein kinase
MNHQMPPDSTQDYQPPSQGAEGAATLPPSAGVGLPQTETLLPTADAATVPSYELPRIPGYEIQAELGRGGMGVVYKARQERLNRPVALKMILNSDFASHDARLRFLAEAEVIAKLQHPNIVQVYEFNTHQGNPFFSLEYVDGGSLDKLLKGQPQPPREAAAFVATLADAVQAAHAKGIVHRDLKPANVLLQIDDRRLPIQNTDTQAPGQSAIINLQSTIPKVADFGLAKQAEAGTGITASGAIMGTPSYMAPEQASGEGKKVGPAADIYALGAILYEMLTGKPPFKAATPLDTLMQVASEEPKPLSQLRAGLPRDLETICLKCLRKEPGQRYATAAALAEDLRRYLDGLPITARRSGRMERARRWCRRNPVMTAMGVVVLLALAGNVYLMGNWGATSDSSLPNGPAIKDGSDAAPPGDKAAASTVSKNNMQQEPLGFAERGYWQTLLGTVWIIRPLEEGVLTGSGVLVNTQHGIVITSYSLIGKAKQVALFFPDYNHKGEIVSDRTYYMNKYRDNQHLIGDVIQTIPKANLALVKLHSLPEGVRAIPLAKGSPRPADRVHWIGNFGRDGPLWMYTAGSVRQVYRGQMRFKLDVEENTNWDVDAWFALINEQASEGDNGSPLINARGELVGIAFGDQGGRGIRIFLDTREMKAILARVGIRSPSQINQLDPERTKILMLANKLVDAKSLERSKLIDEFYMTKGADYTQALAIAIPKLTGKFQEKARETLAERLKRMTDRTLCEYLKDDDTEIRRAAVGAVVRKEAKELAKDLVPLLSDKENDVAEEAYQALTKLTGQDFGRSPEKWKEFFDKQGK